MTEDLRPSATSGLPLASLVPGASGVLTGVSLDSRRIRPGDLYVGLPGAATHGARFAAVAVAAGAIAVLTDAAGGALAADAGVPVAIVEDPRVAMARIAADVYGRPAERTHLFGVTGTNGKTSTVFLLDAALTAVGLRVATIGTIGFRLGGAPLDAPRSTITTPEAPDLQALLSVMVEGGADAVTMEVSSHALALHRVDGMVFDVAAFTMLGHDHLEFHHTLEAYFEAKARLFTGGRCRVAVINTADPWGRTLADRVRSEGVSDLVTTLGPDADYRVLHAEPRPSGGSRVVLAHPGGELDFTTSMLGDFNVANAVTALAMVGARGGDLALAASGLAEAHVPGRMQRVDLGAEAPHVVVDFAHTPQAVQAALAALPATGRHLAVLGAGGDRDPSKRRPMGRAAASGADVVVVTDDNPRSEDPAAIRAEVLAGAREVPGVEVIDGGDRRSAIAEALRRGRPGDWIAVLGKGHESGQEIAGVITPFDDVAVVRDLKGN
ncbi:MAG TPA: UDP-N-acetylmuramoyl-L-alanyl-D-glutamate--2,6-diaminopimelate ligase [Propioniciclava sp.]|jgi:UDP-N-acetylmuramoyl-L-alanyl-D-glutamate--2,6-diaminopimelate ligase|uniref:UDP-N-acetylmuramoyl-L-alanyl-D-glutamate--2, 6-diaminopimelate ligase n=1 Tax=Propioniciclava sp. TaxID=2038686 RepID=UPI002D08BB39|nr:UDP-N-acetylmuramoyl-L-alanyl-D-glutamate--2,6-diaminopimelate ligase [Propioniciclava sp.]HRL48792.1 UDP-N-acetylmuramoyl-L-alanyl-D-glutamate--2,6-diaminopimelate ligase [Propioniciclava sp.]HRL78811.1 UDP-N-acetylmuramoyl-L-alanyl-D-glutamate--2,6-diaminopimelate ligase [Propioniciclava sp.]